CRTGLFDAFHDAWLPEEWHVVGDRAVAIGDGAFVLRPEFVAHWDYIIWLDIHMETMVERARRRDAPWVGSEWAVEERYRRHWIPTHEFYERLDDPQSFAHAIVDNRDPGAPRLVRLSRLSTQAGERRPWE